mmetsp:Transcript_76591/g.247899  ORF Transcript_76591/g.247899 Transcript_76591/m.247899 type:complete len:346 (+) Transcript_76591:698-1735(+)
MKDVAGVLLHRPNEGHQHAGREELGTLEVQNEAHKLVLIGWAWEEQQQEDRSEEEKADPEQRQHGDADHGEVHGVNQLAENGFVKGQIVVEDASAQPEETGRRARRAPCGSCQGAQVHGLAQVTHGPLHVNLDLCLDVLPESTYSGLNHRAQPLPHVRIAHGALLDKLPDAVEHALAYRCRDFQEALLGTMLLLGPPSLQERPRQRHRPLKPQSAAANRPTDCRCGTAHKRSGACASPRPGSCPAPITTAVRVPFLLGTDQAGEWKGDGVIEGGEPHSVSPASRTLLHNCIHAIQLGEAHVAETDSVPGSQLLIFEVEHARAADAILALTTLPRGHTSPEILTTN